MKFHTFVSRLFACLLLAILSACSADDNAPPSYSGANPSSTGPAMVAVTSQDTCYTDEGMPMDCATTGQDGELQKGVANPSPRFTDNGDGTITDNLTGLMWSQAADCYANDLNPLGPLTWQASLSYAQDVNGSTYDCNGSLTVSYNDWRVPNIREMQSLADFRYYYPPVSNTAGNGQWSTGEPFTGLSTGASIPTTDVTTPIYMTSTTYTDNILYYWGINTISGDMVPLNKTNALNNPLSFFLTRDSSVSSQAPVPATGQTKCYDHVSAAPGSASENACGGITLNGVDTTAQDGYLQKGVAIPSPRFTDNGDGTVTDNLTGLMWMKTANCIGNLIQGIDSDVTPGDGKVTWQHALDFIGGINFGAHNCGNTDGNTDWRLPNYREMTSMLNFAYSGPAISNTAGDAIWSEGDPFTGLTLGYYWTSSTMAFSTDYAWIVDIDTGVSTGLSFSFLLNGALSTPLYKSDSIAPPNTYYVWPVRSGN